jgi:hypothetical protein
VAIASTINELNSMSGDAERENPMAAMLVENSTGASKAGLRRELTSFA